MNRWADGAWSVPLRRLSLLLVVMAILFVLQTILTVKVVTADPGPRGEVEVVGPAGGGRVEIDVIGDRDDKAWIVAWPEVVDLAPGERLPVRLEGDCACIPRPDERRALTELSMVAVASLQAMTLVWLGRRQVLCLQQRRAGAVDRSERRAVTVEPQFSGRSWRGRGLSLRVSDRSTGRELGWVLAMNLTPHFDPRRLGRLVGGSAAGDSVLLSSDDQEHEVLPVTPLMAEAPPSASFSQPVVRLLGWDRPHVAEVVTPAPALPSTGRVSLGREGATDGLWTTARSARDRFGVWFTRRLMVPAAGLFLASMWILSERIGLFGVLISLAVPWIVFGVVRLWLARPVSKALAQVEPGLRGSTRRYSALLLIGLVPPRPEPAAPNASISGRGTPC